MTLSANRKAFKYGQASWKGKGIKNIKQVSNERHLVFTSNS
jgi:hypothetical protein